MKTLLALIAVVSLSAFGQTYDNQLKLYDSKGKFRGNLNNNQYDPNSISNPYGRYGNKYSADSIHNKWGIGNKYHPDSPNNSYGKGLRIIETSPWPE